MGVLKTAKPLVRNQLLAAVNKLPCTTMVESPPAWDDSRRLRQAIPRSVSRVLLSFSQEPSSTVFPKLIN